MSNNVFCQLFPNGCASLLKNNYDDLSRQLLKQDFGKSPKNGYGFNGLADYLENDIN